jgi:hypothetical protein
MASNYTRARDYAAAGTPKPVAPAPPAGGKK